MLHILKIVGICILFLVSITLVSATYYVRDPNNCLNNYQSQTCGGSTLVCGYNGGVTFCYDMTTLAYPAGTATSTTDYTCNDATCNGGYLIDCHSYDGGVPYCDNSGAFLCDRNSSCYDVHRTTRCDGGGTETTCTTCVSGYTYCDGSYVDADGCEVQSGVTSCSAGSNNNLDSSCVCQCDSGYVDCDSSGAGAGNGCEVQSGGSCTVGSLSGTYVGCTCTVTKSYFQTGTFIEYLTTSAQGGMLWFKNYFSNGWLINVSNSKNETWGVNNESCIVYKDGSQQCTAPVGGTGDNVSWNESYANTLYSPIGSSGDNESWNQSYATSLYAPISVVDTDTWNSTADFSNSFYPLNSNPKNYYNNTVGWNNLTGVPSLGNSTEQIWNIVNNNSFLDRDDNTTLKNYILYVNSTNGEGGLGSDIYVNETGDSMTGDLIMLLDKCYKWTDGSEICLQSNGNMVFTLG